MMNKPEAEKKDIKPKPEPQKRRASSYARSGSNIGKDRQTERPKGSLQQKRHSSHSENNPHANVNRKKLPPSPAEKKENDATLYHNLKRGVEVNDKVQKNRLQSYHKIDTHSKGKVRITPLGGLGEIGANITVIETEESAIVIDVGMSFPDESMHGVDILIPDFNYLEIIKDKIVGIIITHAHEDHIGAMPYLFKKMQFPIYGTPLPLGMISSKFDEHGLKKFRSLFRVVEKRKPVKIGDFEIEWIHITHSIIDSSALAIRTDAGVILHTGDFKIDHTPIDGFPTDLHRLAHYGEEGVLVMLSDSTNSHKAGYTQSEATVGPTFDNLFLKAKGRVIMSTFSSNIHRVYQAIEHGIKYNRKVAVIGRSMEKNLEISRSLGYINIPQNVFIEAHEVDKYTDEEILIVTTGSQGETMSALYRMATDEHRHIKIKPTDSIIISAKAIPGNEAAISTVINHLMKAGASVAYQDFSEIHVSGHAAQEEQKLLLRLIKPKFFLPVHGEYNHIAKHRDTAIKCGVPEKNILLMEDGDQIEVAPTYVRKVKSIKTGKSYINNQVNREVENDVVLDRQKIAIEGVVFIAAEILAAEGKFIDRPKISTLGIIGHKEERYYIKELEESLQLFLTGCRKEALNNIRTLENEIKMLLRKQIFKKTKTYPTIIVSLFMR
ncbi:ribonuclease J [Helicobacter monodelphidis]|uniref:ribonuclease J n=1 Tax=Helicobacter sp. 15-1451 TaxID=2004995 RepID=UPI000DCC8F34|nr:ribonuclease J [Helicobacter sp. 15-1451]RAX56667.1 ribonuclease J [Helicobacter sp. 15-1451]